MYHARGGRVKEAGLKAGPTGPGWLGVPDDEELFARLHHAELAAGHVFDGARVRAQQFHFLSAAAGSRPSAGPAIARAPGTADGLSGSPPAPSRRRARRGRAGTRGRPARLDQPAAALPGGSGLGSGRWGYDGLLHVLTDLRGRIARFDRQYKGNLRDLARFVYQTGSDTSP